MGKKKSGTTSRARRGHTSNSNNGRNAISQITLVLSVFVLGFLICNFTMMQRLSQRLIEPEANPSPTINTNGDITINIDTGANANANANANSYTSTNSPEPDQSTAPPNLDTVATQPDQSATIDLNVNKLQQSALTSATEIPKSDPSCRFRDYADHPTKRLYGITSPDYPYDFLKSCQYIYGEKPILLTVSSTPNESSSSPPLATKLCKNLASMGSRAPLMDGTNPTIIDLSRLSTSAADLPTSTQTTSYQSVTDSFPTARYVVSVVFKTNHQCNYDLNKSNRIPTWRTHRHETDIIIMNEHFQPLAMSTIETPTSILPTEEIPKGPHNSLPPMIHAEMDDSRLFVHDSQLWVSYRKYARGELHRQSMSPLQFFVAESTGDLLRKASAQETKTKVLKVALKEQMGMTYGRNMPVLEQPRNQKSAPSTWSPSRLQFLQWLDPIWVQTLDLSSVFPDVSPSPLESTVDGGAAAAEADPQQPRPPRLAQPSIKMFELEANRHENNGAVATRRKVDFRMHNPPNFAKPKFHGTPGVMLYIAGWNEYFGMGHFNREEKAQGDSVHGNHGHHYTHSFFTIGMDPDGHYSLRRLSQEFVFPSQHTPHDADVVQFASGMESIFDSDGDGDGRGGSKSADFPSKLLISYGINDCESAVVTVDWKTVTSLLRPVDSSSGKKEAHDLMGFVDEWKA